MFWEDLPGLWIVGKPGRGMCRQSKHRPRFLSDRKGDRLARRPGSAAAKRGQETPNREKTRFRFVTDRQSPVRVPV